MSDSSERDVFSCVVYIYQVEVVVPQALAVPSPGSEGWVCGGAGLRRTGREAAGGVLREAVGRVAAGRQAAANGAGRARCDPRWCPAAQRAGGGVKRVLRGHAACEGGHEGGHPQHGPGGERPVPLVSTMPLVATIPLA